ncbi:MAG: hypothetical protein LUO80_13530, partial [Methylococcaceae bacterium]|nr:hypothetical protein [Methylococcaceae bacterium]
SSAGAALVSVSGPSSSSGIAPQIIAAPVDTRNNATPFSGQVGFDEKQGVVLLSSLTIDGGGTIAAGVRVNSHMIYLERLRGEGQPAVVRHHDVEWTFDGPVLGVMSSQGGGREAASRSVLGLDGTAYAQFSNRGMESNDGYTIDGSTLTVNMRVTEPGDWIRVVTLAPDVRTESVPENGGWLLGAISVLSMAALRRRLGRKAA